MTWIYDEIGCAGAILDEFCIRNLAGHTVGWVFGLSVFSLKGEHIGWFEDGIVFDIDNKVLGFVPGAKLAPAEAPPLASQPATPVFSKRPHVPTLRGRAARPHAQGWSRHSLAGYLSRATAPAARALFIPHLPGCGSSCAGGQAQ